MDGYVFAMPRVLVIAPMFGAPALSCFEKTGNHNELLRTIH